METPTLEKCKNEKLSSEAFQFGFFLQVMTIKLNGEKADKQMCEY